MQTSLIRILPACLTGPLPEGWDEAPPGYVMEVMPAVERPEVIAISIQMTEPDILLLDADFAGLDAFAITQQSLVARPELAVVLVSSDNAPNRLRQAMLAGVEEYLIKPLDGTALRDSIVAIASHRTLRAVQEEETEDDQPDAEGLVVGVVSGKGGLGKTTLAVNMAAIVARTPGKTAAIVGLESGDGAVLLSLQPRLGLMDIAAAAGEGEVNYTAEWLSQFGATHRSGIAYWTWQGSGTQAAAALPDDFFQHLFDSYRRTFAVTLVDFPLLSPDEAGAVLPLLDVIIIVSSTSDLLALRSTKTFFDLIPAELTPRVRIVINRADPSDMISREDFEQTLSQKVAAVLLNQPNITAQAINMGSPFVLTQPQSEIALNLRTLAQVLFRLPVNEERAKPKKRFMLF